MKASCPVCFEDYNSGENLPKAFPYCGHSICLSCLKEMFQERNAVFCPYKCNPENVPVYREPADLTTNKVLVDLGNDLPAFNICASCYYPYFGCLRQAMMLKWCGHSMCQTCIKRNFSQSGKSEYLSCPFDGQMKAGLPQNLYGFNRDFNGFLEECEKQSRCSCNEAKTLAADSEYTYNLSAFQFNCAECAPRSPDPIYKVYSGAQLNQILEDILADKMNFAETFKNLSALKEEAPVFKEIRKSIDKIKEKFSKSINELIMLLDRINSEMNGLSNKIRSVVNDFRIDDKIKIIDEALELEKTPFDPSTLSYNDALRTGTFINQNYSALIKKFKWSLSNNPQEAQVGLRLKEDLILSFVGCFEEFKQFNKNIKEIAEETNQAMRRSRELVASVKTFKTRYDYSKNPLIDLKVNSGVYSANKDVIELDG